MKLEKIVVDIGESKLELTAEQARELHGLLDRALGLTEAKSITVSPIPYIPWGWRYIPWYHSGTWSPWTGSSSISSGSDSCAANPDTTAKGG